MKQANKQSFHSGNRWNLISLAGEARAKMTALKPPQQSLWSSTDKPDYLSHHINLISFPPAS